MNFRNSIDHTLRELVDVLAKMKTEGIVDETGVNVEVLAEGSRWADEVACDVKFTVFIAIPKVSKVFQDKEAA